MEAQLRIKSGCEPGCPICPIGFPESLQGEAPVLSTASEKVGNQNNTSAGPTSPTSEAP